MKHASFYTLLVSLLPGVGPSRYWTWLDIHKTPEHILLAPPETLPKIHPQARQALLKFQQQGEMSPLACQGYQVLETVQQNQACIICHQHKHYPGLLGQISRPPPLLFAKGNVELLSLPQIAIVGTRNPTNTGIDNARQFSRYLATGGFTITSGLALGIDGYAHEAAIKASGKTIAVMATGIDQVYPSRHQRLAEAILDSGGLLLTEFIPGTEPRAAHFPQRNRVISGLSLGTLVVEATLKSGSLITARYAMEQNREIFAIPGSIHNPQSKGCHALVKEGAQLAESGEDIIKQLASLIRYLAGQQEEHPLVGTRQAEADSGTEIEERRDEEFNEELEDEYERPPQAIDNNHLAAKTEAINDSLPDYSDYKDSHKSTGEARNDSDHPALSGTESPSEPASSYPSSNANANAKANPKNLNQHEQALLDCIGYDTVAIDQLIERSGFSSTDVTTTLLNLELKGAVKYSSWGYEAVHEAV